MAAREYCAELRGYSGDRPTSWPMSKFLGVAGMSVTALAGCLLWLFLFLPYGLAEPGSPDGDGFFAAMWILVELPWTWWAFVRRRYDQEITASRRAIAVGVAAVSVVMAFVIGERYADEREWDTAAWAGGIVAIVGLRASRYILTRRALFGLVAPRA